LIRILFGIIASLGLLMALGTVLARNLVHAALFLVGFFFLVACTFVMLEAEFMAAMQVLVYIGAVAILLLFGIMLTRNIQGDETTTGPWYWKLPPAAVALGLLAILGIGILRDPGSASRPAWSAMEARSELSDNENIGVPHVPSKAVVNNMGRAVGIEMMTRFVVPFEVAGLLLTAAVIGAIALAQSETPDDEVPPRLGAVATVRPDTALGSGNGSPPSLPRTEAMSPTTTSAT
jgi:NADH-quinone oxidoreductase subunit J